MREAAAPPPHLSGGQPARASDYLLLRRSRLAQDRLGDRWRRLLDLGCGTGAQTFHFATRGGVIAGVDVKRAFLQEFQRVAARGGLGERASPVMYDGSTLPFSDETFDAAISFEVLEHVRDERATLRELARVMEPGGTLAISVPNRWWIFETHGAALPLLRWNRVPLFSWLPKRLHDRYARARIYRKGEIIDLLQAAGFRIRESVYVTAPMDVVRWRPLQRLLRATIFGRDLTRCPPLSTTILVIAERRLHG
jgi:2-polyprenyl-3-methyl-5-hydroxy-6-metoxy-1,4-benzoquinol methylase